MVLIRDRKEAIDTMNAEKLRNVKQCFSFNIRPGEAVRLAYGYGGGLSQSHQPAFNGSPRMKTDIEYQIKWVRPFTVFAIVNGADCCFSSQREALQTHKTELNLLEQHSREKQRRLSSCEQAIIKHKKVGMQRKIEMQQAQTVVEELQDALDNDRVEEGRLEALKEQLEDAKEDKRTHESSYGESVVAKDKNNESLRTNRDEMATKDAQIKEAEAKVLKAESKAAKCANQRQAELRDMNTAFESVQAANAESDKIAREHEQQVAYVDDFTKQANECCPRVPVEQGETGDSIERKLAKLEKDLTEADKRYALIDHLNTHDPSNAGNRVGGNRAELTLAAAKAVEALEQAEAEVKSIEELTQVRMRTLWALSDY